MTDSLFCKPRPAGAAARWSAMFLLGLSSAVAVPQALSVTDFQGQSVRLAQPARRLVALAPHLVENIYSAGAGDYLVGLVSHSNFPAEARGLPIVGSYNALSYEAILAVQPDLVLAWSSGNGATAIAKLRRLGLTVYVDEPDHLDDVARSLRNIGVLTGRRQRAARAAANYLRRKQALADDYENRPAVSVLYQVWNEPLQTVNGEHIISSVIELCGGVNAFGDARALAPKISLESVFARDPDVVVASGSGAARPAWLDAWRAWPQLKAVANGNLYALPPDVIQRHTVRILDGAERLCRYLQQARTGPR